MTFPSIEEAESWFTHTDDGLTALSALAHHGRSEILSHLSEETLREIFQLPQAEFIHYIRAKRDIHEMFACLALLACCEGRIREDLDWRAGQGKGAKKHHLLFQTLLSADKCPGMAKILAHWRKAVGRRSYVYPHLENLEQLFVDRNVLAHGRADTRTYQFGPILDQLVRAKQKWREEVPDFRGF